MNLLDTPSLHDLTVGVPIMISPIFGGIPAIVGEGRRVPASRIGHRIPADWSIDINGTELLAVELDLLELGRVSAFPHQHRLRIPSIAAPQHWNVLHDHPISHQTVQRWLELIRSGFATPQALKMAL